MKEQEVEELENSGSGSEDHGTPSVLIKSLFLKSTIQPICTDFLLEKMLRPSNVQARLSFITLKNCLTYF